LLISEFYSSVTLPYSNQTAPQFSLTLPRPLPGPPLPSGSIIRRSLQVRQLSAAPGDNTTALFSGVLSIISKQCCMMCNEPSNSSFETANGLEQYEILSPNNHTLLHNHPSCDNEEVRFKSSVYTNGTYNGMLNRSLSPRL
jgi:hypothetical protein